MAQCSQSAQEFIQAAFGPMVAVVCSDDTEVLCAKNNVSFTELVRPFCQLTSEAHIRDPNNRAHPIRNWKLRFIDISYPQPPTHVVNKLLKEVVLRSQPTNTDPKSLSVEYQKKASTPWFEAYRDCYFQLIKPSEHEFIRHFVACLFVVSTSNPDPMAAFAKMHDNLTDLQQNSDWKWLSTSNTFKYNLLLHDLEEGKEFEAVYHSLKAMYGTHACHLLQINSRDTNTPVSSTTTTPNMPDPWTQFILPEWDDDEENAVMNHEDDMMHQNTKPSKKQAPLIGPLSFESDDEDEKEKHQPSNNVKQNPKHKHKHFNYFLNRQYSSGQLTSGGPGHTHGMSLTVSDHDRIRIFIHEFAIRGLLPYIERTMRNLNDQILARKGLHRSIFTATKKWFSVGKPAGLSLTGMVTGLIYSNDAPELHLRKLGDLAFLVQNYEMAYECYHATKRDFNNDHAWFYFAGALEMAAVSAFMAGIQRPYPTHYMETAVSTYISACRQSQFAQRTVLLNTDCLKDKGYFAEAAVEFVKMTSEEFDLQSALMLEQAGHCYLQASPPMIRKYSFNMILAGHRFSKAAQRKHALRCYQQALQVYKGKGWKLAEDHINFTLGRQSFNLRLLESAQESFRELLIYKSQQSAQTQASYLREFLIVFKQLLEKMRKEFSQIGNTMNEDGTTDEEIKLPHLPLPIIKSNCTQVITCYRSPHEQAHHTPSNSSGNSSTNSNNKIQLNSSSLFPNTSNNKDFFNDIKATPSSPRKTSVSLGQCSFDSISDSIPAQRLAEIEEKTYEFVNKTSVPVTFKPSVACLNQWTDNSAKPLCVVNEIVGVQVSLSNPLAIPLNLGRLSLVWRFHCNDMQGNDRKFVSNKFSEEDEEMVCTEVIKSLAIAGNESKEVQLCVTPKQTGELSITGIKYTLTSVAISGPVDAEEAISMATENYPTGSAISIKGHLDLEVRGPRLNASKAEKTSVVYGNDNRLNIVVVPPMPRLEVDLEGFPSQLLCGEVKRVMVHLKNLGQCPLRKLYLTSSHRLIFQEVSASADSAVIEQVYKNRAAQPACAIQYLEKTPSAKNPVKKTTKIPIPGDCLHPGASVSVSMWLQGSLVPARHQNDLLFYYEPVEIQSQMTHRALHHTATLNTARSLVVRATGRRAKYSKKDEDQDKLVIALDIENLVQDASSRHQEFSVTQITCVSRTWTLQPLSHRKEDGVISVNPGETVMVQFKAEKWKPSNDDSQMESSLKLSHISLTEKEVDSSVTPASDFFFCSDAWNRVCLPSTNNSGTKESVENVTHVGIGLIVFWRSTYIDESFNSHTSLGQCHVDVSTLAESISAVPQAPGKRASVESSLQDVDNMELLVKYSIHHPGTYQHDFHTHRICSIPVDVVLHNCCSKDVDIYVEMGSPVLAFSSPPTYAEVAQHRPGTDLPQSPLPSNPIRHGVLTPSSTSFYWIGKTSTCTELPSQGTTTITFMAGFSSPGVYNLNHLRVCGTVKDQGKGTMKVSVQEMVPQKVCPSSLMIIENVKK